MVRAEKWFSLHIHVQGAYGYEMAYFALSGLMARWQLEDLNIYFNQKLLNIGIDFNVHGKCLGRQQLPLAPPPLPPPPSKLKIGSHIIIIIIIFI